MAVSAHRGFDYEELLTATLALQGGAALFGTSRDPTLPMPGGAWPGTGAILAAVETACGKHAEIGGKPEPHLFELARERIPAASRVAMVGDRVSSDIEGGRRAGLETVLVLSRRLHASEAEAATPPPDHVVEDLRRAAADERDTRRRRRRGATGRRVRRRLRRHLLRAGRGRGGAYRSCLATSTARSTAATSPWGW